MIQHDAKQRGVTNHSGELFMCFCYRNFWRETKNRILFSFFSILSAKEIIRGKKKFGTNPHRFGDVTH